MFEQEKHNNVATNNISRNSVSARLSCCLPHAVVSDSRLTQKCMRNRNGNSNNNNSNRHSVTP